MKEELAALYALQQIDSALAVLQKHYAALDQGQAERAAADTARAEHKQADATLHTTSAELHDAELEQKSVEAKAAEFEKKLYSGTVHAPKELQAMQDEIEMLKRQRGRLDEKILLTMETLETCRLREAQTKKTLSAAKSALNAKLSAYKSDVETLKTQARALTAQRAEAVKPISPALLKRYDSLRASKGGLAIGALIDGNACGCCQLGLPSSLVEKVLVGNTIEICDNCGRILCIG